MGGKIIAAGHICLDITPVFSERDRCGAVDELLRPGKLISVRPAEIHAGGSVANTGLALKLLGADVRLMGKIGDDLFGALVRDCLRRHGGADDLIVDPGSSTSYSIVLAPPGIDRIFLHNPGANDTFSGGDIPDEALTDAVWFHFGYPPLMRGMYEDGGAELAALLRRVRGHGIVTSLDLAAVDPDSAAGQADWAEILARVLPQTDFFVPSFEELSFMLDRPRHDALAALGGDMTRHLSMERDVRPLGQKCLRLGCRAVLIKCGLSGLYYCTAERTSVEKIGGRLTLDADLWAGREGVQPCFRADAVRSGTGAGDASIAAFLAAVMQGRAPDTCAALAAAEGACAVTAYDALGGLRPLDQLEERIASGWAILRGERDACQPE